MGAQLRNFFSGAKTAQYVLFAFPVVLADLDGNYAGPGGEWLQLIDKAVALVGGEVPVASFPLTTAGPGPMPSLFQTVGGLTFVKGLTIAISSTRDTCTVSASGYDVFGQIDEYEKQPLGTVTTSTATNVNSSAVWANGTHHNLFTLSLANANAYDMWAMLFCDAAVNGDTPIFSWKVPATTTRVLKFGNDFVPFAKTALGVEKNGCSIYMSSASGVLTTDVAGTSAIIATYQ